MELVKEMLAGQEKSLARLITMVEREDYDVPRIMKLINPHLGKGYRLGVTGMPGGGKSTIVDRLTKVIREKGLTVGIVCADPTSPFTGGAVLGDRIRMQQHYLDNGVFIRSMASRGSQGGLPINTRGVTKLLDAFGKDFIIVETVGVGQTELDVMENVDTVIVVLTPESGDAIQTMKAGLLEIADIFAVNKADRPGVYNMVGELEAMIELRSKAASWKPPVLATQAVNNVGMEKLYLEVERHRQALEDTGQLSQRRQLQRKREFIQTVQRRVTAQLAKFIETDGQLSTYMEKVERGEIDPYSAARKILSSEALLATWSQELAKTREG